jgi:hypothetical protein
MILFIFLVTLVGVSPNQMLWLSIAPEQLLIQTIFIYYLYRLGAAANLYQLVGYATLSLVTLGSYLFWLQFDVFACFLLVAESIVMLFVLSLLMHLNYSNIGESGVSNSLVVLGVVLVLPTVTARSSSFTYWVDWYASQLSQYNDLLPQYLYFYNIDSPIVWGVGVWLLILTFLLVHLILSISLSRSTGGDIITYTRKVQNVWSQWYKKPVLRFFKK